MEITCPKCGEVIVVRGLGRKSLNIPVNIVCDALQSYCSVGMAAEKLECSRPFIYKVLKDNGLTAKGVINGEGGNDGR